MPATVGDVWRIYIKPSMKGAIIARKKTVNRMSARVIERNKQLEALRGTSNHPARLAHNMCINEEPWRNVCVEEVYVYKDGTRKIEKRCKIACFRRLLKLAFQRAGLTKYGGGEIGGVTG